MDVYKAKKVHFIGIGGIGISYLAQFFIDQGAEISGSDLNSNPITELLAEKGATIYKGHDASNVKEGIELVIANDAVPVDNVERARAKELGIPVMSNFASVGQISKKFKTIAVAGNKGKTTTSAMLAVILEQAGMDPTAMIGSLVNQWGSNFRAGNSELLVVEADEYREHFLNIDADIGVITNIAADHLDYFKDEQGVINAFQKLVDKLPKDGTLVINAEDALTKKLSLPNRKTVTFGFDEADVIGKDISISDVKQYFTVVYQGETLGECTIAQPGRFNIANALAAIAVALSLDVPFEKISEALEEFKGTWRRFQLLGRYKGAIVVSDYAHHPVAVEATIKAAKEFYPGHKIVAVFQSHSRHRTKSLFDSFVLSLDLADVVIIPEIFEVSGREVVSKEEMNGEVLVEAIKVRDKVQEKDRQVLYAGSLEETKTKLDEIMKENDVILFMGAGDIYRLAESLI